MTPEVPAVLDPARRDELRAALAEWGVRLPQEGGDDVPLISSGVLDSLGLFRLSVWVEQKVGHPIDPTTVDLRNEWDTLASILHFIDRGGEPRDSVSAGYSFVEYAPEFKERVLALQKHLWSPDLELNRAYFEWKHEQNPYFKSPVATLAVRGDEVVGMRTMMGSCWEVGRGRPPVVLPYADDLVVAPEHRGSGLAGRIMASVVQLAQGMGAPYLVNLSAGSVTALLSLANGWRSAGPMLPVGRRRGRGLVGRLGRRFRRLPVFRAKGGSADPFVSLDGHARRGAGKDAIVVARTPRPEAMAHLVERRGYDGRIRHLRDATFFAWRFQNPLHKYRFLFQGDDELAGYLVLQYAINRPDDSRVWLVDWEASDVKCLEALLAFAVSKGKFDEIHSWEAAQPSGAVEILRRHRFEPAELERRQRGFPAVLVLATDPVSPEWLLGEKRVLDPGSWDMRLLYSMHG